ncbi:MAG: hypothetical protein WD342_20130 [Verrucomicrobiales bacterium]
MKNLGDRNWTKFWLHFAFGAIIGIVIGFGIFAQTEFASATDGSRTPILTILSISSLTIGLLGGLFGDDLWAQIHKLF